MTVAFYAFDMLTGRRLTPLPVSEGSWKITTNADEQISVTIPARAAITRRLDVWGSMLPVRTGILATVDNMPVAAGPIWKRSYTQGESITLTAGGLRSYWERRIALPVEARTTPLVNGAGDPDTSLDFFVDGLSMGTIAKRYVEMALAWPDGEVPMVLPADELGTHEDGVKAIDLKTIRRLLDNLQARQGGPDIAFRPRWALDGLGIYWEMQVGTNAQPRLGNTDASLTKFAIGSPRGGGVFGLSVDEDATGQISEAWAVGGSGSDLVVAARSFDDTLIADHGFPLLQGSKTGLTDVSTQGRVQEYADQAVSIGQHVASFWSMGVRAHERGVPPLGDWWLGDLVTLDVGNEEPVIPTGQYVRRIASIGGDALGHSYDLVFAEAVA